jgi:high affinity sulfate transporter 1
MASKSDPPSLLNSLQRFSPGLRDFASYRRADVPYDLMAGLSVAAVALPVGVAYAQLAGFAPQVGLYASILPLVAYALFGTSRQLIVGPDAATCALIAASITPLAAGDPNLYSSLSLALAFLSGLLCVLASFLRLGVLADFLSKPILVGFLNGMAISIALGQIGKIFGFAIERERILPRLLEFIAKLGFTHWPTLGIGVLAFLILVLSPRVLPRIPAALLAMAITGLSVNWFDLESLGVKTVGLVPAGLPPLHIPSFPPELLPALLADAAGLALIGFSSMMLTARSFAAKNKYEIDADREFAALGAANMAAALSQGFAISGADSRTAMNDTAGGRTRVAGLFTALTVALVLLFFTHPLQFVPIAALGAVLVKAAFGLLDLPSLRSFYRIDKREFALSLLAMLGVASVGAVQAILVAVVLALVRFLRLVSRPKVEVLGSVPGLPGFHSFDRHEDAEPIPGLLLLRFNAPIVFFNAPYFKRSVLEAADAAGPNLKWVVIDMIPITLMDVTGLQAISDVTEALRSRGISLAAAGRLTEWQHWARQRNLPAGQLAFPTLRAAVKAFAVAQTPPLQSHDTSHQGDS